MDLSGDPFGGGDSSAGRQARQPPRSLRDGAESLSANPTNPVQVMPCQIQMFAKFDDQGRRYMVLENLPLDKNYVANYINNGAEFAIGGTPDFISDALRNELAARAVQDSRNQCTQSWHVVVLPDANITNAAISNLYRGSEATERYPIATALRPAQQALRPQQNHHNQKVMYPQQYHQGSQQSTCTQQNPDYGRRTLMPQDSFLGNQQPMLMPDSSMGGDGGCYQSVSRSQQSQFTTPMSGAFSNGGESTMMFGQEQFYSQAPQQGSSFQGFGPINGLAQGNYQDQSNNTVLNQNNGLEPLPQVHRPIFDKHGYIVGEDDRNDGNMYGDNLYNDNMYQSRMGDTPGSSQPVPFQGPQQHVNPPQQVQNIEMRDPNQVQDAEMKRGPQLAAAAQSFYSFVTNKMDLDGTSQGEGNQDDQDEDASGTEENENQDEGIAMGNTGGRDANSSTAQQAPPSQQAAPTRQAPPANQPESPPAEILLASEREAWRFTDNTQTGLCDYCGREGHEADTCLKWDPTHYDKPVCTACNNDQHSLDECPRFRAMPTPEKQALLLDKGAGRPGVRSQYHPWTSYVHRNGYASRGGDGDGVRLPLTRRFLFNLSVDPERDEKLQNVWKVWDYNHGVPDQFRDPRAESLADDPAAPVDERFMDGKHGLGWKIHPPVTSTDATG